MARNRDNRPVRKSAVETCGFHIGFYRCASMDLRTLNGFRTLVSLSQLGLVHRVFECPSLYGC